MFLALAMAAALMSAASSAQECVLESCPAETTCYSNATAALDCLASIPFNEAWADQTVLVLSTSLENFGFDALYHATGPPYVYNIDVQGALAATSDMIAAGDFATDLDFQEHVQGLFQVTTININQ